MKISLGSILYCWKKNEVYDFYDRAKSSDVDIIYLGEAVCAKRKELSLDEWIDLAKFLSHSGKEVILTTLALVDSPSKLNDVKRIVGNGDLKIETNDFSAVNLCFENKIPFVAGHALNVYNAEALTILKRNGMYRWCAPVELSHEWYLNLKKATEDVGIWGEFEKELLVYGYLPLSYSARCFTARSMGRDKADCEIACINDPCGKVVYSQDETRIFTMNGIQMQSGSCYDLVNMMDSIRECVDIIRLSPLGIDIFEDIKRYRDKLHHPEKSIPMNSNTCIGYWNGEAGMNASRE